ncbi:MAG: hypothetical protein BWK75_04685 [Candidatus Altiarchaeales archaeon A3]|nr:MAG: hypothetical protein BWK75_04685 [Candidatus Altiarchaeales archaeon A3]
MAYSFLVTYTLVGVRGAGKSMLYWASDVTGGATSLPSGSVDYLFPSEMAGLKVGNYEIKDIVVIGTPVATSRLEIWIDDTNTGDSVVLMANLTTTVNRQFQVVDYYIKAGKTIKFIQR